VKVYVAGSSAELERAQRWIDALRAEGWTVTSDWPAVIASVGDANPRDASVADRRMWSHDDLRGVDNADVVWLLAPKVGTARGAYFELGYAMACGKHIISSGDTLQSIFLAHTREYATDEAAFDAIVATGKALRSWEDEYPEGTVLL
jgi:nucleoside 2-deoxyribosyltransferase